jgi:hypothetical protein
MKARHAQSHAGRLICIYQSLAAEDNATSQYNLGVMREGAAGITVNLIERRAGTLSPPTTATRWPSTNSA